MFDDIGGSVRIYGTTLTRQQRVRKEKQVKVQQTGKPDLLHFLESGHRYKGNLFVSHVDAEFDQLNLTVPCIILQEHVDGMSISQNSPFELFGT
jgi:hypothetical protein